MGLWRHVSFSVRFLWFRHGAHFQWRLMFIEPFAESTRLITQSTLPLWLDHTWKMPLDLTWAVEQKWTGQYRNIFGVSYTYLFIGSYRGFGDYINGLDVSLILENVEGYPWSLTSLVAMPQNSLWNSCSVYRARVINFLLMRRLIGKCAFYIYPMTRELWQFASLPTTQY